MEQKTYYLGMKTQNASMNFMHKNMALQLKIRFIFD